MLQMLHDEFAVGTGYGAAVGAKIQIRPLRDIPEVAA
jgi:hypothetical protein